MIMEIILPKKKKFIKEINSEDITTITKFENLDNQYFLCLEKKGCFLQMNILYFIIFNLLTFGKIFENIFFENVLIKKVIIKKVIFFKNENEIIIKYKGIINKINIDYDNDKQTSINYLENETNRRSETNDIK